MAVTSPVSASEFRLETAEEHLSRFVPIVAPDDRAELIRKSLSGKRFDSASHVAVCEGDRLVGLIRLVDLLAAPGDARARAIMDPAPPVVAPGADQEIVAWSVVQRGESSVAVVDAEGTFLGLIPPARLLAVLLWEHDEDLARIGGFVRDTAAARSASEEPMRQRFLHRLPWLAVGVVGAMVAALSMAAFEEDLERSVTIAFFVPSIVYLADAVGTQTETIVIRGLSVGVPIRRVLFREATTGVLVGLCLAAVVFPLATLISGDVKLATAVALSLLMAASIANLVAMALPWLFQRSGMDPAFGSGPIATVIQDVLSLLIYLGMTRVLV